VIPAKVPSQNEFGSPTYSSCPQRISIILRKPAS
jgi:hypothetical protein